MKTQNWQSNRSGEQTVITSTLDQKHVGLTENSSATQVQSILDIFRKSWCYRPGVIIKTISIALLLYPGNRFGTKTTQLHASGEVNAFNAMQEYLALSHLTYLL